MICVLFISVNLIKPKLIAALSSHVNFYGFSFNIEYLLFFHQNKIGFTFCFLLEISKTFYFFINQHAQAPPSMGRQCPLMNEDFPLSKNIIGSLTSFNSPKRFNGMRLFINFSRDGSLQYSALILVIITVGLTLLQRIFHSPNSSAKARVSASTAA